MADSITIVIPQSSFTGNVYLTPGGTSGNRTITLASPPLTVMNSPENYFVTSNDRTGFRQIAITSPGLTTPGSPATFDSLQSPVRLLSYSNSIII